MIKIPKLHIGNQFTDNQCCFGLAAATAVAAGASLLGSLFSSGSSSAANRRNLRWQAQQAKISRDWQAQQSDIARNWMESMQNKYNTPSAQRAMIERAGYNPYLLSPQGFEMNTATSAPSGATATVPSQFDAYSPLAHAATDFGSLLTSLAGAKSSQAQASNTDYMTKRQQLIDAVNNGDMNAVTAEGLNKIYESQAVKAAADKTAAEAAIANIQSVWMSSQALDENSQPVVNDDGSPVSNYEYEQRGNQANIWKGYNKLQQDITESAERVANLKVDELTKKYNLDELLPAQKAQILTSISKLKSDIELNNHQMHALDASAYSSIASGYNAYSMANYNRSLTTTENMLRPSKLGLNDWQIEALKRQSQLTKQQTSLAKENTRKASHDWNSFGPYFGVNSNFSPNDFGMIKFGKKVNPGFKTYSPPKSRFFRFFKFVK